MTDPWPLAIIMIDAPPFPPALDGSYCVICEGHTIGGYSINDEAHCEVCAARLFDQELGDLFGCLGDVIEFPSAATAQERAA